MFAKLLGAAMNLIFLKAHFNLNGKQGGKILRFKTAGGTSSLPQNETMI